MLTPGRPNRHLRSPTHAGREAHDGEMLESMAVRGLIYHLRHGDDRLYMAVNFIAGIYEFQLNNMDREFAVLMEEYLPHILDDVGRPQDQPVPGDTGGFRHRYPAGGGHLRPRRRYLVANRSSSPWPHAYAAGRDGCWDTNATARMRCACPWTQRAVLHRQRPGQGDKRRGGPGHTRAC